MRRRRCRRRACFATVRRSPVPASGPASTTSVARFVFVTTVLREAAGCGCGERTSPRVRATIGRRGATFKAPVLESTRVVVVRRLVYARRETPPPRLLISARCAESTGPRGSWGPQTACTSVDCATGSLCAAAEGFPRCSFGVPIAQKADAAAAAAGATFGVGDTRQIRHAAVLFRCSGTRKRRL